MKLSSMGVLLVALVVLSVAGAGEVEGQALTEDRDTRLAGLPSRQVREVRGGEKKIKKKKKKNSNERKNKVKAKGRI